MDSDRILELIDNVLPFEVCLYYRVIPLKIAADRIQLGMVDPEDGTALDYLNRLFQHVDRTLVPNAISADVHQLVMSQYLNRLNQNGTPPEPPSLDWLKTVESDTPNSIALDSLPADSILPDSLAAASANGQNGMAAAASNADRSADTRAEAAEITDAAPPADFKLAEPAEPAESDEPLHVIPPEPPNLPVSMLVMLPPERLLPALLARVLSNGIGRLFFERREKDGSILYSQDGVQQAVLDALPVELFEATLARLKQFVRFEDDELGDAPGSQRETDSEFLYRDERVLLRLRVMAGNYGEEATLQVLRGRAMDFYQEQKLAEWSLAALSSAKLLKDCVRKIRSAYQSPLLTADRDLRFLPQLEQLLDRLETEMEELSHDVEPEGAPDAPSPTGAALSADRP